MFTNIFGGALFDAADRPGTGTTKPSIDLSKTSGSSPPFEITVFNSKRPLSKTIKLKDDGTTLEKGHAHPLASGYAIRYPITGGMQEFATVVNSLNQRQAIATGQLAPGLPDAIKIAAEGKLQPGEYTRARANVVHLPGEPGLALLDFDRGGMPQEVKDRLDALGGFESAIMSVVPELAQTARLLRPSTSAGIRNIKTGEVYGAGGYHLYVLLADATDSEYFLKLVQQHCWLHGLGWMTLSKVGSISIKSIVDVATWGSERLCYEGPPMLGKGLAKEPRACQVHEGSAFDTRLIPDLDKDELAQVYALCQAERERLKPETVRLQSIARQTAYDRERARGATHEEARRAVDGLQQFRMLPLSHLLYFNGWMDVAHILENPQRYADRYCADPEEGPDYGTTTAVLRVNDAGIFIDSCAHGAAATERQFWLKNSEATLLETQDYWMNLPPDHSDWTALASNVGEA